MDRLEIRRVLALVGLAVLVSGAALWFGVHRAKPPAPPVSPPAPEASGLLPVSVTGALVIERRGELELRWDAVPGADRYQVWFYASDLRDLASPPPVPTPSIVLKRGALPLGLESGTVILWRVGAYRAGQQVAQSLMTPAKLP